MFAALHDFPVKIEDDVEGPITMVIQVPKLAVGGWVPYFKYNSAPWVHPFSTKHNFLIDLIPVTSFDIKNALEWERKKA